MAAVFACLGLASAAGANSTEETVLQDDPRIVYQDNPNTLNETLAKIKSLGVDTIRVSLFWHLVAPDPTARDKPDFGPRGAAWPGSYEEARWARYDRIVNLAHRNGLKVLFSITGPAPLWATPDRYTNVNNYRPAAADYRDFVAAVGLRYSGFWPVDTASAAKLPIDIGITNPEPEPAPTTYIPRVDHWSLWNEPNFPGWLLPQWKRLGRKYQAVSPAVYRRLVDAGWIGLQSSTHSPDTILLGETAPYGPHNPKRPGTKGLMAPPQFIRELYCLNPRYRPFKGSAARRRRCPSTAAARHAFRSKHPALFNATGWAHHAYSLKRKPTFKGLRKDSAPLGAVSRLYRTLDRAQFRWGAETGDWTVWITEYGYQTVPDPFRGVSYARQASWLSWAEYLTYRNPRIGSFGQFLLYDDAPRTKYPFSDKRRWATWQSGLITDDGRVKTAFREFPRPIHVTPGRGKQRQRTRVFGIYRTAGTSIAIPAQIQFRPSGGDAWQTLDSLTVGNMRGYLSRIVRVPGSGSVRIVWTDPVSGAAAPTRAQYVARR